MSTVLLSACLSCSGSSPGVVVSGPGPLEGGSSASAPESSPWARIEGAGFDACEVEVWPYEFGAGEELPARTEVVERLGALWRATAAANAAAGELGPSAMPVEDLERGLESLRNCRIGILELLRSYGTEFPADAGPEELEELGPPEGSGAARSLGAAATSEELTELTELATSVMSAASQFLGPDPTCDLLQFDAYCALQREVGRALARLRSDEGSGEREELERSMPVVREVWETLRRFDADRRGVFERLAGLSGGGFLSEDLATIGWNVIDVCGWAPEETDDSVDPSDSYGSGYGDDGDEPYGSNDGDDSGGYGDDSGYGDESAGY